MSASDISWSACQPAARQCVEHMRRCTPTGAAQPWRSGPSVAAFEELLTDGITREELFALIEGAAELVVAHKVSPSWWYPQNLCGARTCPRWRAEIAEHAQVKAQAQARRDELEVAAKVRELERLQGAAAVSDVRDLGIARLAGDLRQAMDEREATAQPALQPGAAAGASRAEIS